jgi:hypothetical protein
MKNGYERLIWKSEISLAYMRSLAAIRVNQEEKSPIGTRNTAR